MLLKMNGDADVRTLLAWLMIVSDFSFMHGGYADGQARYTNSVRHSNCFS